MTASSSNNTVVSADNHTDTNGTATRSKKTASTSHTSADVRAKIVDIRRDKKDHSLASEIYNGLRPENGGEKRLPTLLLYDEKGLKLFEKITYLDEYYLTNAEIEVLERHADDIAQQLQPGSIVLELGSG